MRQTRLLDTRSLDRMKSVVKNRLYLQTLQYYDIDSVWPYIQDKYDSISRTTRGRYSKPDILQLIKERQQQIWLAREMQDDNIVMVCTTEIMDYPQRKTLLIHYCTGDNYKSWLWVLDEIEAWARTQDFKMIEIYGRKGWQRILKDYKLEKIILSKDL